MLVFQVAVLFLLPVLSKVFLSYLTRKTVLTRVMNDQRYDIVVGYFREVDHFRGDLNGVLVGLLSLQERNDQKNYQNDMPHILQIRHHSTDYIFIQINSIFTIKNKLQYFQQVQGIDCYRRITYKLQYRLILKRRIYMTFVYRAPKITSTAYKNVPGPGEYLTQIPINNTGPSSVFVSKVQRRNQTSQDKQVGPGSYLKQSEQYQKELEGQSMFKSKINRFKENHTQKQTNACNSIQNQFNQLIRCQTENKCKIGKLIRIKDISKQKLSQNQNLPSIPCVQNSFGYQFDPASNKMVLNQNPKLIFANNLKALQKGEDYFFQRSRPSLIGSIKCNLNSSSKRSASFMTHLLDNPGVTQYHSQKYKSIQQDLKDTKKLSVFNSKVQRFQEGPSNKKEILKYSKLKRDFGKYLTANDNFQELEKLKHKSSEKQPVKSIQNRQFFLSKSPKFKQQSSNSNMSQLKQCPLIQSTGNQLNKVYSKKQQVYGKGEPRFKQSHKQHIGPGVYQISQQKHAKAVILKLSQDRFKISKQNNNFPGPGQYSVDNTTHSKEKTKFMFNRYRNQAYFDSQNKIQGKFSSMQNLYQQIGKKMSYLSQLEKQQQQKNQKTKKVLTLKKQSNLSADHSLNLLKNKIKHTIGLADEDTVQNTQLNLQQMQNIRYSHLYNYCKPPTKTNGVGPGHYQVASTLDKKTYNKSVFKFTGN